MPSRRACCRVSDMQRERRLAYARRRLIDGKIAAGWGNFDTLGLLRQLGAIAVPGEASTRHGGWEYQGCPYRPRTAIGRRA